MYTALAVAAIMAAAAPTEPPSREPDLLWDLTPARKLSVQLPGLSHHFSSPTDKRGRVMPGKRYNERNWGIGVEFEDTDTAAVEASDHWIAKTSFGVLKDSLNAFGLYAGRTMQRRIADKADFSVDVGAGAFLFLRTMEFDGPHRLVPAVLPVVSAMHKPTQVGVNLVAIPEFTLNGSKMPGVVFLQFTRAF
jgi:hypothetical protein